MDEGVEFDEELFRGNPERIGLRVPIYSMSFPKVGVCVKLILSWSGRGKPRAR